jgi:ABC-type polysaccharide/polyol phosphate export permease
MKRILGLFWIILGPAAMIFMAWQAYEKVSKAEAGVAQTNTALQWGIILLIFIPIAIGLVIFGKYALAGEYDKLPESSEEV